jgi:RNA polymerase sigma-B factor
MPEPAELLAGRVARGDDAAAEDLVEAMRPLVASMATRFQGRVPRSDLEQAGVVGLLRAAATFDAERGTPFGGYASPFVMGEMLACVRQQSAPVRVPRSVTENERAVAASVDLLTATHGRSPTVAEIAEQAKLDEEAVLDALRASMAVRPVSLDEIEPERFGETDETLEAVERRLELGSRLDRLDRRSRAVLVLRFGMELSQREIAERLGISQMHVSRLLRAAMAEMEDQGGDDASSG